MTTRPRQPKRPSTDRDKPRGRLEALARRQGGHGYSFTPHALFRFSRQLGLKPMDLLVLLAILSHADNKYTDYACASYDQLADDTTLDVKTVKVHVRRLKELDLLTWNNRRKADKSRTPNTYNVQLLAEKLTELVAKAPEPEPERDEVDDFDALLAELMVEAGRGADLDEPGGVEVPVSVPRKRKARWATKDPDDDERDGDDGHGRHGDADARPRNARATPRSPSPAAAPVVRPVPEQASARVYKRPTDLAAALAAEEAVAEAERERGGGRPADDEHPAAVPGRSGAVTMQDVAPSSRRAAPSCPWQPGSSRLRPAELDDADHDRLDRGERLIHPDGRELTVDEHLYRMREMERYSRPRMADILIDLGFPSEEVTAAMNADPVERLRRLSGASSPVQVPERKPDVPAALPMPPNIANDPVAREAWEVIERIRLRRLEKERGGQS